MSEIHFIRWCLVRLHRGFASSPLVRGQVAECEVEIDGEPVRFWVRENTRARDGSGFVVSANERAGRKRSGYGEEILQLAAPHQHWKVIAGIVAEHDEMQRPVVRAKHWTPEHAVAATELRQVTRWWSEGTCGHWRQLVEITGYERASADTGARYTLTLRRRG